MLGSRRRVSVVVPTGAGRDWGAGATVSAVGAGYVRGYVLPSGNFGVDLTPHPETTAASNKTSGQRLINSLVFITSY